MYVGNKWKFKQEGGRLQDMTKATDEILLRSVIPQISTRSDTTAHRIELYYKFLYRESAKKNKINLIRIA